MEPTHRVVGLAPQTSMVFTVVKPVMGLLKVSPPQTAVPPGLQGLQTHVTLQNHALVHGTSPALVRDSSSALSSAEVQPQNHALVHGSSPAEVQPQIHLSHEEVSESLCPSGGSGLSQEQVLGKGEPGLSGVERLPFAEVSSLLDPNMKGSKARKYLISYDEIRRRLQPPEKMSLRSIAAYTRVSRGPASKRSLQESLSVLGLSPGTTTAVSSSFSKLTEGDTRALCDDMRDFSQDYVDYEHVAKQLIPETNTVQHWSKIIETKNHLDDVRRCLQDPAHSQAFDSVTHGLGLGMIHVVLDMVSFVIQHQVRILSGSASTGSDLGDQTCPPAARRGRKRQRKFTAKAAGDGETVLKARSGGRGRKKARADAAPTGAQREQSLTQQPGGSNVLLVTVGYEAVSNELNETVSNELGETVSNELNETVSNELGETVSNELNEAVSNELNETVSNELGETVSNELNEAVSNELNEAVSNELNETVSNETVSNDPNALECVHNKALHI